MFKPHNKMPRWNYSMFGEIKALGIGILHTEQIHTTLIAVKWCLCNYIWCGAVLQDTEPMVIPHHWKLPFSLTWLQNIADLNPLHIPCIASWSQSSLKDNDFPIKIFWLKVQTNLSTQLSNFVDLKIDCISKHQ